MEREGRLSYDNDCGVYIPRIRASYYDCLCGYHGVVNLVFGVNVAYRLKGY